MFARLAAMYGHKFTSAYGEDPASLAGDTWAAGLAGLTNEQLADGLRACITRNDAWPPSLPEFRGLCMGVPCIALVKAELLRDRREWSQFTHLVARYLDVYALRMGDQRTADRLIQGAYDVAQERVMRGETLPPLVGYDNGSDEPERPYYVASVDSVARHAESLLFTDPDPKALTLDAAEREREIMARHGIVLEQTGDNPAEGLVFVTPEDKALAQAIDDLPPIGQSSRAGACFDQVDTGGHAPAIVVENLGRDA